MSYTWATVSGLANDQFFCGEHARNHVNALNYLEQQVAILIPRDGNRVDPTEADYILVNCAEHWMGR